MSTLTLPSTPAQVAAILEAAAAAAAERAERMEFAAAMLAGVSPADLTFAGLNAASVQKFVTRARGVLTVAQDGTQYVAVLVTVKTSEATGEKDEQGKALYRDLPLEQFSVETARAGTVQPDRTIKPFDWFAAAVTKLEASSKPLEVAGVKTAAQILAEKKAAAEAVKAEPAKAGRGKAR